MNGPCTPYKNLAEALDIFGPNPLSPPKINNNLAIWLNILGPEAIKIARFCCSSL
jgi:hypothetical protein